MVDGPKLLAEALAAGVEVTDVVAEPGAPEELVARAEAAGATVHRVPAGSLAKAVDTQAPQPVAAVATMPPSPWLDPGGGARRDVRLAVVAVALNDPGNAGTILRSADAAGADLVAFCDDSVDPYGPKAVRASAGALFRLPTVRAAAATDVLGALRAAGVRTLGLVARGGAVYDTLDYAVPSAVVLGSEAHGLPATVESLLDELVTIPMCGPTESLNVGMAGTIVCFEALRQRRNRDKDLEN
ncbi:MAG TPA: RNA methyltransferase [Acidimicrobiales bacterium]